MEIVPFSRKQYCKVKPSPIQGMGLFATKNFKEEEFVTLYGGVEITEEDQKNNPSEYVIKDFDGKLWDASIVMYPLSEMGRWINDGRGTPHGNNCRWNRFHTLHDGQSLLGVVTIKPIREGEEFFINYGPSYWEHREDDPLKPKIKTD